VKIAVLGGGKRSLYIINKAHELGHQIILAESDVSSPAYKLADENINIAPSDTHEVIEALKNKPITFCFAEPTSPYQVVAGAVNDAMSLKGVTSQTATYCYDKYTFHNRMRNKYLRPGHCYLLNKENSVDLSYLKFPIVLKPRFGHGCKNVYLINNEEELFNTGKTLWNNHDDKDSEEKPDDAKATDDTPYKKEDAEAFKKRIKRYMQECINVAEKESLNDTDFIIEEAFEGAEYAIDGVVEGCNFEPIMVRKKIKNNGNIPVARGYITVVPQYELRLMEIINEYMGKVVEALSLKYCMLHADIIISGRKAVAIEVDTYPAFGHIHEVYIPITTGINIYKEFLAYMNRGSHYFRPQNTRSTMLHYFDMENCFVHRIPKIEELELPKGVKVKHFECNLKTLDYLGVVKDEADILKRGYYILEAPKLEFMEEAVKIITDSFECR